MLLFFLCSFISFGFSGPLCLSQYSGDGVEIADSLPHKDLEWKLDSIVVISMGPKEEIKSKSKTSYYWDFKSMKDTMVTFHQWGPGLGSEIEWKLQSVVMKYHDFEQGIDTLVNQYRDYSEEAGQFARKIETRLKNTVKDTTQIEKPLDKKWSGTNHHLYFSDSIPKMSTTYFYTTKPISPAYILESKKISTYDDEGRKTTYSEIKNRQANSSLKRDIKYEDGKVETLVRRHDDNGNTWVNNVRLTQVFDDQKREVKYSKEIWLKDKSEWFVQEAHEIAYEEKTGQVSSRKYFNDIDNAKYVCVGEYNYKYNTAGQLIGEEYEEYDHEEQGLEKYSTTSYTYDDKDLLDIKLVKNYVRGYDLVQYKYEYDDLGRSIKMAHRNKQEEMPDWRFVNDKHFLYHFDESPDYTTEIEYNEPGEVFQSRIKKFDVHGNIIESAYLYGGEDRSKTICDYYLGINLAQSLIPESYTDLPALNLSKWTSQNSVKEIEQYYHEEGNWVMRKQKKFYFSRIE